MKKYLLVFIAFLTALIIVVVLTQKNKESTSVGTNEAVREEVGTQGNDSSQNNEDGGEINSNELNMANPASVHCEEQGGKVDIREDEDGNQSGFCVFEEGIECEEWTYYRGECEPGKIKEVYM